MPKVNIYLPDDLAAAVRARGLPVSAICQMALRGTLDREIPDSAVRITEHIDTDLPFSPHLASVISLATRGSCWKRLTDSRFRTLVAGAARRGREPDIARPRPPRPDTDVDPEDSRPCGARRYPTRRQRRDVRPRGESHPRSGCDRRATRRQFHRQRSKSCVGVGQRDNGIRGGSLGSARFLQVTTHQALGLIEVGVAHANRYAPAGQAGILTELAKITDRLERLEASLSPSCS